MNKNKDKLMFFIIIGLLLLLFNLVAFLIPFGKDGNFWVGYSFTTLAFLISAVILFIKFDNKDDRSKFYAVSIFYVLLFYIIVQAFLGVLQMGLFKFHYRYSILINAFLLVVAAVGLISLSLEKKPEDNDFD